jgi:hypothetical protein
MSEKPDIKKALETIVGYELTEDAVQRFKLFSYVAAYDFPNSVTEKSLVAVGKNCYPIKGFIDVSGWWVAGGDGKSVFRLTDFTCIDSKVFGYALEPINVVVTPATSNPCFATVLHTFVKGDSGNTVDIEIQVFLWDANGAPRPFTAYNWRCRFPYAEILT